MSGEGSRVGSGRVESGRIGEGLYTMIQLFDAPFHRLKLAETSFHGFQVL